MPQLGTTRHVLAAARPGGVAAEPDDHGLGRSRGGPATNKNRTCLRRHGIRCTIPDKADQVRDGENRGSRADRPPKFDPGDYNARYTVECGTNHPKRHRVVATRSTSPLSAAKRPSS